MSIYTIEECFLYKDSIKIAGLPIYIFDDHSMALPAWGVCSSRLGKPLNLITFDSHTDTHPSFNSFVVDQTGKCAGLWHRGLKNPEIKKLLENVHYCADDFCFEDVYKITVSYLKNSEQILTGVDLGYLSSYVVVTKERDERKASIWSVLSACSLVCSFYTLYRGIDKMTNYYNSENYPSLNENAYVGGDAYNYIINGNYATAFFVLTTMFVLAAIGLMILHYISRDKQALPVQTTQKDVIDDIESNLPQI